MGLAENLAKKNEAVKVLHFDRDITFLKTSKEILQLFGNFEIDLAANISEANKALTQKQYDVIVCGYNLDDAGYVNGIDFFKKLRADGNKTPFILFTIHDEIEKTALKLGVTKFIDKNKDCETVYTRLSNSIREAKSTIK